MTGAGAASCANPFVIVTPAANDGQESPDVQPGRQTVAAGVTPRPYYPNMGSNWRSGLPARTQPETTAVLVSLDALFPLDRPPTRQHEGLVLTGWTAGVLHRWLRSATGQWIGVVTILIPTTNDGTFKAQDQLVPAEALRPRHTTGGAGRQR